jgi:hypothetical protein
MAWHVDILTDQGDNNHRTKDNNRTQRYLTSDELDRQVAAGLISILSGERNKQGLLKKVTVELVKYGWLAEIKIHAAKGRCSECRRKLWNMENMEYAVARNRKR